MSYTSDQLWLYIRVTIKGFLFRFVSFMCGLFCFVLFFKNLGVQVSSLKTLIQDLRGRIPSFIFLKHSRLFWCTAWVRSHFSRLLNRNNEVIGMKTFPALNWTASKLNYSKIRCLYYLRHFILCGSMKLPKCMNQESQLF